jgi:hypothetical protein
MYNNPQFFSVISKKLFFFKNLLEYKVGKLPRIVGFFTVKIYLHTYNGIQVCTELTLKFLQ